MVSLKLRLLAAIIQLFSSDIDKCSSYRSQEELCENLPRLEVMAEATAKGSHNLLCQETESDICWDRDYDELAFNMLSIAYHESAFLKRIHEGKCLTRECDPVFRTRNGHKYLAYHRARSSWQVHKSSNLVTDEEWKNMIGTDLVSTTFAATAASRIFTFSRNRCRTDVGGFAMYGTGKVCKWKGAKSRDRLAKRLLNSSKDEEWVIEKLGLANHCN